MKIEIEKLVRMNFLGYLHSETSAMSTRDKIFRSSTLNTSFDTITTVTNFVKDKLLFIT